MCQTGKTGERRNRRILLLFAVMMMKLIFERAVIVIRRLAEGHAAERQRFDGVGMRRSQMPKNIFQIDAERLPNEIVVRPNSPKNVVGQRTKRSFLVEEFFSSRLISSDKPKRRERSS